MRKFQEEQAVERELERDEAAKQIQTLQDRLREREREKDRDYRINSAEVIKSIFTMNSNFCTHMYFMYFWMRLVPIRFKDNNLVSQNMIR